MKKTLTLLAALAMASSVYAQGTVEFGTFNSQIFRIGGTVGAGAGYTAGLFLVSDLNTPLATTDFIPGTGFLNPINVTVPGVPGRTSASFVIFAWDSSVASFDIAAAFLKERGFSSEFTIASLGGAGSPPDVPASLDSANPAYTGFTMSCLPEPSTYALGIAGLGALAMMRRRK